MKKDVQTQFRLSEAERQFLEFKGDGSLARGLKVIMEGAGFSDFLDQHFAIKILRQSVANLPDSYVFFRHAKKFRSSIIISKNQIDLDRKLSSESVGRLRNIIAEFFSIDLSQNVVKILDSDNEDAELWSSHSQAHNSI